MSGMTEKSLETRVEEAAAETARWREKVGIIQSKINAAKQVLAGAE